MDKSFGCAYPQQAAVLLLLLLLMVMVPAEKMAITSHRASRGLERKRGMPWECNGDFTMNHRIYIYIHIFIMGAHLNQGNNDRINRDGQKKEQPQAERNWTLPRNQICWGFLISCRFPWSQVWDIDGNLSLNEFLSIKYWLKCQMSKKKAHFRKEVLQHRPFQSVELGLWAALRLSESGPGEEWDHGLSSWAFAKATVSPWIPRWGISMGWTEWTMYKLD